MISPNCDILRAVLILTVLFGVRGAVGADIADRESAEALLDPALTLPARPPAPGGATAGDYLDVIEEMCRSTVSRLDDRGAVIDPFAGREHQYSTPYFVFAASVLLDAGRARDLLPDVVRAMDHATETFAAGNRAIPERHGEFYLAPLAGALERLASMAGADRIALWRERLSVPLDHVIDGFGHKTNNWRTYAMRGEWMRARAGLADPAGAREFIARSWTLATQRERMAGDRWNLYQDWSSDPQSMAVEAVGRGNLLGLVAASYDGEHADEITALVERGTRVSLLLQDPTGQCPPNGRTDDHVFNDVLYLLAFEIMAAREAEQDRLGSAGGYRRAASLAFESIGRWRRTDGELAGTYQVTKNHFDPALRVGYQPASQDGNYNGAVMAHLAEAYLVRTDADARFVIPRHPAPAEVGGYAFTTDSRFGVAIANAGGTQIVINLRGDNVPKYGVFWTPLGGVRVSRPGWDSRLGPSDGAFDGQTGATLGPEWRHGLKRVRLSEQAEHYQGTFSAEFVHPLLVRCSVLWHSVTGSGGPSFLQRMTLTPDGILIETDSPATDRFGFTVPLLADDGRELEVRKTRTPGGRSVLSTRYSDAGDEQAYLLLDEGAEFDAGDRILSTYGWLEPVRVGSVAGRVRIFIYPRTPDDPSAEEVLDSFEITPDGFRSILGRVQGDLYAGRTAAGGFGDGIDADGDGTPDIGFETPCRFLARIDSGRITKVETSPPGRPTPGR